MTRTVRRVCSFESRRADEMRSLLERHGFEATVAPSMRELPLDENPAAIEFARTLQAGGFDIVVFLTGVGARTLFEAAAAALPREELVAALNRCVAVVRGPKAVAVLKEWGVRIDHRAPEPNTWRELLRVFEQELEASGKRIAIQEYGVPNDEFYEALRERGAMVTAVPVYRWGMPDDVGPLRDAIERTIHGDFDAILFTSAQQLVHAELFAAQMGCRDQWLAAAKNCIIGSIGPTASETIREFELPVHLEPEHPKMGVLVRVLAERYG